MSTTRLSTGQSGEPTTLTKRARRTQLIDVTVELVADQGYAGVSLSGIAEQAGITKAAVLYHFPSTRDLVHAAYQQVRAELTADVGAAVEAAPAVDGPAAYVRSMITHLSANPRHTRMIIEGLSNVAGEGGTSARWGPLARIIETARDARGLQSGGDSRTAALLIGGAIDAIVNERQHDAAYDTAAAAEQLVALVEHILVTSTPAAG